MIFNQVQDTPVLQQEDNSSDNLPQKSDNTDNAPPQDNSSQNTVETNNNEQNTPNGDNKPTHDPASARLKLYNLLHDHQVYSKSYNDFEQQFNNPTSILKLHNLLNSNQVYSKSSSDFYNQFFPEAKQQNALELASQMKDASNKVNVLSQLENVNPEFAGNPYNRPNPDEFKKTIEDNKNKLSAMGYSPEQVNTMQSDIATLSKIITEQPSFNVDALLNLKEKNPQQYERQIGAYTWQGELAEQVAKQGGDVNGFFQNVISPLVNHATVAPDGQTVIPKDYNEIREDNQKVVQLINQYAPDDATKKKWLNAFSQDAAINYSGFIDGTDKTLDSSPNKAFLNNNQLLGRQFLKDTNPDEAKQFDNLLVDKNSLTPQEKLGYEYNARQLDLIGANTRLNATLEKLNDLPKVKTQEDFNKLPKQQQQEYISLKNNYLQLSDYVSNILNGSNPNYKNISAYDNFQKAQDVLGIQNYTWAHPIASLDEATGNLAKGVKNILYNIFASPESNNLAQLDALGADIKNKTFDHLIPKNSETNNYQVVVAPELQSRIDEIKNDPNLSNADKLIKTKELMDMYPDQSYVKPTDPKQNFTLRSIAYSMGDTVGQLVPFLLTEGIPGFLGAELGTAGKMVNTFVSAYANGFENNYVNALQNGSPTPFKDAAVTTTIQAVPYSLLQVPTAIKKIVNPKTAIGGIINNLSDKEITNIVNTAPRAGYFDAFKKTLSASAGLTGAGIIGQVGTALYNNQEIDPKELAKQIPFEFIKNTLMLGLPSVVNELTGRGYEHMNDIKKLSLFQAAVNPGETIEMINKGVKDGTISQSDAQVMTANVNRMHDLANSIEFTDNNGHPLSDQDAAELFRLKLKAKNIKEFLNKHVPPDIETKAKETLADIDNQLNTIYNPNDNVSHGTNDNVTNLNTNKDENQNVNSDETMGKQQEGQGNGQEVRGKQQKGQGDGQENGIPNDETGQVTNGAKNSPIYQLIDRQVTYKGKKGMLLADGDKLEFHTQDSKQIYEIGNLNDLKDKSLDDIGITENKPNIKLNEDDSIDYKGKKYSNPFPDNKLNAIQIDKDGKITGVKLFNDKGKTVTFRGQNAEDIAYQLQLKEKSNATKTYNEFLDGKDLPESHANVLNDVLNEIENEKPTTTTQQDEQSTAGTENEGNRNGITEDGTDKTTQPNNIPAATKTDGSIPPAEQTTQLPVEGSPENPTDESGKDRNAELFSIARRKREEFAKKVGIEAAKTESRGMNAEKYREIANELLDKGIDPYKIIKDFKEDDNNINAIKLSVVSAYLARLKDNTYKMGDEYGMDSEQYKQALSKYQEFEEAATPMTSEAGYSLQSIQAPKSNVLPDSPTYLKTTYKENKGLPLTEKENQFANDTASKIKEADNTFKQKLNELDAILSEDTTGTKDNVAENKETKDKNDNVSKKETKESKDNKVADFIRKFKIEPLKFKDKDGNEYEVQVQGLSWNDLVEAAAQIIEKTGDILDGINHIIDKLKNADWYKKLSEDDKIKLHQQIHDYFFDASQMGDEIKIQNLKDKLTKLKQENNPNNADEISSTEQELKDAQKEYKYKQLKYSLVDKKDDNFTPKERKGIWEYAKDKYIDKYNYDFDYVILNTADDLGLDVRQVKKAFLPDANAKKVTDEMYAINRRRRAIKNKAIAWAKSGGDPKVLKFFEKTPDFFFSLTTFGHGTVGMFTHAGKLLQDPTLWKIWFPHFAKQFKMAFGDGLAYKKMMNDFVNSPEYNRWLRHNLAIDPKHKYGEYENMTTLIARLGEAGTRGFNVLKLFRLNYAEALFNKLPDNMKDEAHMKQIADIVNTSTGVTGYKLPGISRTLVFAPDLELSRWKMIYGDHFKVAKTLLKGENATAAEKYHAKFIVRRSARMFVTYLSALALNQSLISAMGGKNNINFTNPSKSDWLRFKMGNETIEATGGMLNVVRIPATLAQGTYEAWFGSGKMGHKKPEENAVSSLYRQFRYKASPFASTVLDLSFGSDAIGRPLPYSKVKPPKGRPRYSLPEYILSNKMPIPLAEATRVYYDTMREGGMSKPDIITILKSILIGGVSGLTGIHINETHKDY